MLRGWFAIFLSLFCAQFLHAQLKVHSLHYLNRIDQADNYLLYSKSIHSSVLPRIDMGYKSENSKLNINLGQKNEKFSGQVYPLIGASVGIQGGNQAFENTTIYDIGAGAGIDFSTAKFFATAKWLGYRSQAGYVRDSLQRRYFMDPGASRTTQFNAFYQTEAILAYRPHRFFTFSGGYGKQFIGEGYRSLILSDNATPNPFFKIETAFANIKYTNLYHAWRDNTLDPALKTLDRVKFSAMHYLSWNITKRFNLSIFETVIWQNKDSLTHRGFDPNYLNPIVFYRPVEYGNGSADNVLLGANLSYKFDAQNMIYSQFILDDFLLSEIRARSRWWANKYGVQLGYKSSRFLAVDDLYFQTELNVVRPFTYSHKYSLQSYANLNAPVAHPLGANFYEVVNITSYKREKFRFTNKLVFAEYGKDTSAVSHGQNVLTSYNNRSEDYNHHIGDGFKQLLIHEILTIEYPLNTAVDLFIGMQYQYRYQHNSLSSRHNHQFSVTIRSRIWNQYRDI